MTDYATPADVAGAWRALTTEEEAVATNLIGFASEIIRARVPDIDDRIAAGTISAELVKHVTVAMVLRQMRNPDGIRQSSTQTAIDDYTETLTETRDQALSAGGIFLTDDELKLLSKRGSAAFSIAPTTEPATDSDTERIAAHRASWQT